MMQLPFYSSLVMYEMQLLFQFVLFIHFTSHPEVELLHDDVVLEVRVPPEVKTDPVAQFVVLEGLDL